MIIDSFTQTTSSITNLGFSMPANEEFGICLKEKYNLNQETVDEIISIVNSYKEQPSITNDFLSLSHSIILNSATNQTLNPEDATVKAPKTHRILFENDVLRILDVSVNPGESVPLHTHQWDSIFITLQGSTFQMDGGTPMEWSPSVEKIEGDPDPHAYTNIGLTLFRALAFEIKGI